MTDMPKAYIVLLLFLVPVAVLPGQLYKWTDEGGNIHYGDSPPAQKEVTKILAPPKADEKEAERLRSRTERLKYQQLDQEEISTQRKDEAEQRKQARIKKQKQCDYMKGELKLLRKKGRHVYVDENGNEVRIGKEKKKELIEKYERLIAKNC